MLDTEEYLHLALHASAAGELHACLGYLREVLQREPRHARALYLLAIQHAELGLFDRAIEGLRAALAIESQLDVARLQLGLLLIDRNRQPEAKQQFSSLTTNREPVLRICSEAMIAFCDGNVEGARDQLAKALSAKSDNRALMTLIQRLLSRLSDAKPAAAGDVADTNSIQLGAYARRTP